MKLRRSNGFTLVELMVAMVGFALVSLAAFSVLQSGQRTQVANDQVVKIQQSVRLALDLISRDIRMSGYGTPAGVVLPIGCGSPLAATDNFGGAGPDMITVVTVDQVVGTLAAPVPPLGATTAAAITVAGLDPTVVAGQTITLDGVFTAAIGAPAPGVGGTVLPLTGGAAINSPRTFATGTSVVRLFCVTYTVTGAAGTPPYQLMRNVGVPGANPVPIVDGIESIQMAYALDTDNDGIIDNQAGSPAGFDCLDFVPNVTPCGSPAIGPGSVAGIPASVNTAPTSVRQVRLTVVGRAIPPTPSYFAGNCWRDPTFTGLAAIQAENHFLAEPTFPGCPALAPGTPSGIRRRALTRIISLRDTTS